MKALAGRRILVLEDEYDLARELERVLDVEGAIVFGPLSALEQTRYVPLDEVDAAILDIKVRDGTTFELGRQLRARGIPFVFASGLDRAAGEPEWREHVWIEKPYEAARVIATLLDVMKARDPAWSHVQSEKASRAPDIVP